MSRSVKQSFAAGNIGEAILQRLLSEAFISSAKNSAKKSVEMVKFDYLASLNGVEFRLEVKFDQMEAETGNIAVEYWNTRQNKPSGLLATSVELWVFVLHKPVTVWLTRTCDLRRHFDAISCSRDILCGGDGNAAMKLYRREELFDAVFHRIDHLEPWELAPMLRELLESNLAV